MNFADKGILSGVKFSKDGFLIADAFAVRTGIQLYDSSELGLESGKTIRVFRSEDEVRSVRSMQSFSHAPITVGHPAENVTAENWKDHAVGEISTEAEWKDGKIKLPLIFKDKRAIDAIESGCRELSAGYSCILDFTEGVTKSGEIYDAAQKEIRINHLALVKNGRAGSAFKVGDEKLIYPIDNKGKSMEMKTVILGDVTATIDVVNAAVIEKFKTDQAKILADAKASFSELAADRDIADAKKDAEIKDLKSKVLDTKALDALVGHRATLIDQALKINAKIKPMGLSDAELRKATVIAALGDEIVKDKTEAYIDARFQILAEEVNKKIKDTNGKSSPLHLVGDNKTDTDLIYDKRDSDLSNAWKTTETKGDK